MFWGLQSRSGLFDKEEHTIAHPLCTGIPYCFLDGKTLNKSLQWCFFPFISLMLQAKYYLYKMECAVVHVFVYRRVHSCMWYPPNQEKHGSPKGHIVMLSANTDTLGFRGCQILMLRVSQLSNTGALGSELKASNFDTFLTNRTLNDNIMLRPSFQPEGE